jgi:hypothetical protein
MREEIVEGEEIGVREERGGEGLFAAVNSTSILSQ